jgi:hexosaminidase
MTPTSHCYLDYYQSQSDEEPLAIGGFLPLEKVYSYDPMPAELNAEEAKFILGVQGNVWTEYITTPEYAEYMVFPRAIALAETGWTPQAERNYKDFTSRLVHHFSRLNALKVNYANHVLDVDGKVTGAENGVVLHLNAKAGNYEIQYMTVSGKDLKTIYKNPIEIKESATILAATHSGGQQIGNVSKFKINLHKAAGKAIEIATPPHPSYNAGGKEALVNGISGSDTRYGDNEWLGWEGENFEGTIDLGKKENISQISLRFFNSPLQWIYLPKKIEVFVSDDGAYFTKIGEGSGQPASDDVVKNVAIPLAEVSAQFIKIKVERFGIIPKGKQGAGHEAWLFVDEIVVK